MLRLLATLVPLILLCACSPPQDSASSGSPVPDPSIEQPPALAEPGQTGSAPPRSEVPPPARQGLDVPNDAVALGRIPPPARPAAGLSAPETGTGEYVSTGWSLPGDGATPSREDVPVPPPSTPKTRAQELDQEARIVEDLPDPAARIVEELPPVE